MARHLLNKTKDPGKYKYRDINDYIKKIINIIREAEFDKNQTNIFGLDMGGKNKRLNRCGLPTVLDYTENKNLLFLADLHRPLQTDDQLKFDFVQRSNYFSFFGNNFACEKEILEATTNTTQI